jgi:hypothetical protein
MESTRRLKRPDGRPLGESDIRKLGEKEGGGGWFADVKLTATKQTDMMPGDDVLVHFVHLTRS